jgi:phosphoribosylformimino-5-aminoimidazole carboxamide ribotide isomerase
LDLAAGRAVHARGGQRERYAPVREVAGSPIEPGDALALACAYTERLGLTDLYVADLDAIRGVAPQDAVIAALAALDVRLWLDAGASSVESARRALELGATRVVVGLETLESFDALTSICAAVGGERVAFSLDVRDGEPVLAKAASAGHEPASAIAARAAASGAGSVIVIDLARVGSGEGLDLALIARVRDAVPSLTLLAGGGVRGLDDVRRVAVAGCDGVLVATALHDGQLGAAEIRRCLGTDWPAHPAGQA